MQLSSPSRKTYAATGSFLLNLVPTKPPFLSVGAVLALALLGVGCGANVCVSSASIVSTAPTVVTAGGSGLTMAVNGSGFTPSMQVLVNNNERPFQFVTSTQILVLINSGDIATPGTLRIVVQSRNTNAMCGVVSSSVTVTVT